MTESKEDPLRFIDGPEVPPATDAGTGVTSGFNPEEKPVKPPREVKSGFCFVKMFLIKQTLALIYRVTVQQ